VNGENPQCAGTRHAVSPPSCRSWFSSFSSCPAQRVHYVGEQDADEASILGRLSGIAPARIVFHASHRSLARDQRLAAQLRRHGHRTVGPTAQAVRLGLDKLAMNDWFREAGIATPGRAAGATRWVVKPRFGTEGAGMRLVLGPRPKTDERHYAEPYVEGEECSIVLWRDADRTAVLPPVWKGRSNSALVPPYRRMRTCPGLPEQAALEREMIRTSTAIAAGVPCEGWLEVEFVVDPDGRPLVLEINPRVSGTMRLAAMSAQVPIFDIACDAAYSGLLRAHAYGVEVPWQGPVLVQPENGVFATSRLTLARASREEALAALHHLTSR
jgi:ATP-grasp domain